MKEVRLTREEYIRTTGLVPDWTSVGAMMYGSMGNEPTPLLHYIFTDDATEQDMPRLRRCAQLILEEKLHMPVLSVRDKDQIADLERLFSL